MEYAVVRSREFDDVSVLRGRMTFRDEERIPVTDGEGEPYRCREVAWCRVRDPFRKVRSPR